MRYYKITLGKGKEGELIYPLNYQEEVGNHAVDHLYWDEGQQTYLLLVIPDKAEVLRDGIEEITEAEAKTISNANETKVELVKDEVKLRRLELKAILGHSLSADEVNAVDVEHPDSVFGTTKTLSERIDEIK